MKNINLKNLYPGLLFFYSKMVLKTAPASLDAATGGEEETEAETKEREERKTKAAENIETTDMVIGRSEVDKVKETIRKKLEGTVRKADIELIVGKQVDEHNRAQEAHMKRITKLENKTDVDNTKLQEHDVKLKEHDKKLGEHDKSIKGLDETVKRHDADIASMKTAIETLNTAVTELKASRAEHLTLIQNVQTEITKIKEGDYGSLTSDQRRKLKAFFINLGITNIDFENLPPDQKNKLNILIDARLQAEITKLKKELEEGMFTAEQKKEIIEKISQLETFRSVIDKKVDDLFESTFIAVNEINNRIDELTRGGLTDAEKEVIKTELKTYITSEINKIKDNLKDSRLTDDEVSRLKTALTALEAIQTTLAEHGAGISEINENINTLNSNLKAMHEIFTSDISELRDQIKGLVGLDPEQIKKILEALKNIEALNDRVATLEGTVEGLKDLPGTVSTIRTELDALQEQVKGIKGLTPEQEKMLDDAAAKLEEHTKQIEKLGTDLAATQDRVTTVEDRINQVEFSLGALQSSEAKFREEIDDLITSNEDLHDQITKILRVQDDMDTRLKALEALRDQIEELLKMKGDLERLRGLKDTVDEMLAALTRAKAEIKTLQEKDAARDAEIEELRKRMESLEELRTQVNQLQPLLKDMDSITRSFESVNLKLRELGADNKKAQNAINDLQALSNQAEGLKSAQEAIRWLQDDMAKIAGAQELQKKIQDVQQGDLKEITKYKKEFELLGPRLNEITKLTSKFKDMEKHILRLEEDLQGLGNTDKELNKSIVDIRVYIHKLSEFYKRISITINNLQKGAGAKPAVKVNEAVPEPEPLTEIKTGQFDEHSAEIAYNKMAAREDRKGREVPSSEEALNLKSNTGRRIRGTGKTARKRLNRQKRNIK